MSRVILSFSSAERRFFACFAGVGVWLCGLGLVAYWIHHAIAIASNFTFQKTENSRSKQEGAQT